MGILEETLKGKSLADYTHSQLKLALGAVLYTNTADMWKQYLNQLGYSGDVSQMLQKYYVDYNIPAVFRNYVNAGASIFNPQNLFAADSPGVLYDNNDFVNPTTWRRNLLTYSEQFDNAAWQNNNISVSANSAVSPNGTSVADKLTEDITGNPHYVQCFVSVINSTVYSFTCYAKSGGRDRLMVTLAQSTSPFTNHSNAVFDLSAGTVVSTTVGSASITAVGGGWYRLSVVSIPTTTTTELVQLVLVNTGTNIAYTGDGTSGIYVWGAQLEAGAFATSYQRITNFNSDFLAEFPRTTLYEDAAGTIPARVNGLVGLQLDKSQGLVLGAEIVTNSDFSLGSSGWDAQVGWSFSGGKASVNSTGIGTTSMRTATASTDGKWYSVTFTVDSVSGTGVRAVAGLQSFANFITTPGTYTQFVLASGGGGVGIQAAGTNTIAVIDNVSVKELPGNHRYQTTTGSKPILRGTPTGANLASGASWTAGTGWSVAGDTATATLSIGTLTAASIAAVVGKFYRVTYTITRTAGSIQPTLGGRTGASRSASGTYVQYFDNATSTAALVFTGTGFTGTVTLNTIEAVDISADSVTAPYALQFDGVDDFLQTAAVNFTATDKMFVCAGVRKFSDASAGMLVELSANVNTNNGSFYIAAPNTAGTFDFLSKGTANVLVSRSGFNAPISAVLAMQSNISAPTFDTRVNGVASTQSTSTQGTGNYGNYAMYFGRRGGASVPYNGLMYSSVCIGRLLTAAELANVERWVARKTGVAI